MLISGIEVEVARKPIKNMYLRVRADGSVWVSVPKRRSDAEVAAFVKSRLGWINARRAALSEAVAKKPPQYIYADGEFKRLALEFVKLWELRMGVSVERVTFREMKTRWGSCTPKTRRIRLNTNLERYPPECLEYIVLHELAHLLETRHNARFYAIIAQFMPDWKARKAMLTA
ncbi:MAG: M48 family metallopeptidase [Oscillospiraceae bacterium]|jgi:predicted metal-dependent hydrolase|nr:M48 family metallopeptidase [Oscillospiraceae bacterium]